MFFFIISFFFFKQKTAYDMRISDWSSDVCSSDLAAVEKQRLVRALAAHPLHDGGHAVEAAHLAVGPGERGEVHRGQGIGLGASRPQVEHLQEVGAGHMRGQALDLADAEIDRRLAEVQRLRSEEHTSELQSLMRISYAVFCLKKTTQHRKYYPIHRTP